MKRTMNLWVFYGFRNKDQIYANFHYDIRNQRIKIRNEISKKSEVRRIRKYIHDV